MKFRQLAAAFLAVVILASTIPATAMATQAGSTYRYDHVMDPSLNQEQFAFASGSAESTGTIGDKPSPQSISATAPLAPTQDFVNSPSHLRTSYNQANYLDLAISGNTLTVSGRQLADNLSGIQIKCGSSSTTIPATSGTFFTAQIPLTHQGSAAFNCYSKLSSENAFFACFFDRIYIEKTADGYRIMPSQVLQQNIEIEQSLRVPILDLWPSDVPPSVAAMSDQIVGSETDDYAKVFLLHKWVAENIYYDYDCYQGIAPGVTDPASVLECRRSVCQGYAELLQNLILAQGIPALDCLNDAGFYTFGAGNGRGHAHVVAFVDGRWITMDPTWDSQNEYRNGSYQKQAPYAFYYFDITPEAFALDHKLKPTFRPPVVISGCQIDIFSGTLTNCSSRSPNKVVVPKGVKTVAGYAFSVHTNMTDIICPDGLEVIEDHAFWNCRSLARVHIPASVTSIHPDAFISCSKLTDINFGGTKAQWAALSYPLLAPTTVHCTDGDIIGQADPSIPTPVEPRPNQPTPVKPDPSKPAPVKPDPNKLPQNISGWAQSHVSKAVQASLVPAEKLGNDYTRFITRGEFAALAVKAYEASTGKTGVYASAKFADGSNADIAIMYELGVISGYNTADSRQDVTMGIHDKLTREQAAVILAKLAAVIGQPLTPAQSLPFTDKISPWAVDGVSKVYNAGIMQGYDTGAFGSQDSFTIEQSIVTTLHIYEAAQQDASKEQGNGQSEEPSQRNPWYLAPEDYFSGNYEVVVDENGLPHAVSDTSGLEFFTNEDGEVYARPKR